MDAPTILREGTGYVVLYEQFGIEVRASNPTKRFGRPEMEVRITIPATGSGDGRVYWGGVGLMSKSNVKETITRCNRTAPRELWANGHQVEWDDIIDDLCWRLLLELRKPPVSVHVGKDAPPADKPVYQLYPLLQKDVPTIIYGDSGVGKSLLATFLAALVTNGTETTGLNPDPGNVLYMDWETSKEILHERIWAVKQGSSPRGPSSTTPSNCATCNPRRR